MILKEGNVVKAKKSGMGGYVTYVYEDGTNRCKVRQPFGRTSIVVEFDIKDLELIK